MQTLQPAPTLKDLRDRIDEATEIAEENATWNGFDDEAYLSPNRQQQTVGDFPKRHNSYEWRSIMKKAWMRNPHAGGTKISPQLQKTVEQRIKSYADQKHAGRFLRIDVRFKGQFCYIDAFKEPYIHEPHNEELFGPKDEFIERMRTTPTHLVRLRFLGDMAAWSVAFFKYSDMKYEPCLFDGGGWTGTLEQAFEIGSVYLD